MKRPSQHEFEPEEVMAYFDGELGPQQAAALASHLEHCSECQAMAAQLGELSARLLDFQTEASPARLEEPITAALQTTERHQSAQLNFALPKRRRALHKFAWAAGAVAAVLAICAVGVPLLRQSRHAPEGEGLAAFGEASNAPKSLATPDQVRQRNREELGLARPGVAPDHNGLFHGLGDNAALSFSVDGSPATDQQSKTFSNASRALALQDKGLEAPELRGPMIVRTASITILASDCDQAGAAIARITTQHGGYVQGMNADTRTGMARSVSATLRVPDNQLEAALADLRKLGHVEQETRNNQEVTEQYIDLTARLKAARATEQRIRELLATRTGKLSDVLAAEQELARIRGEIESMDGQRTSMEHQVRYATVQVQLSEVYREQLNAEATSTGTLLRNAVVEGFRNLRNNAISLLVFLFAYGPSIIFWVGLPVAAAWFAWRRYRRYRRPRTA